MRTDDNCFTTCIPNDDYVWTAGFFNERFPDILSPLGWSVIRRLVEQTAFREPLSFLGYSLPQGFPLTKLYRGHPYTNVGVFQRLYRPFPAWLVPEDAERYFPGGDVDLRLEMPLPESLRFVGSVLHTMLTEAGWHPLNYRVWQRFALPYDAAVADCRRRIEATDDPQTLVRILHQLMGLSQDLLRLHRWSITYAEVFYTLLRRLLQRWMADARLGDEAALLVSGLPNRSTQADMALDRLAQFVTELNARTRRALEMGDYAAFLAQLDETPAGRRFRQGFSRFLTAYGHRSRSLDVRCPAYADDPIEVLHMVRRLAEKGTAGPTNREAEQACRRQAAMEQVRRHLGGLRWPFFQSVLGLAQQYMRLREDQRFDWQKVLHAKRRAFLRIGDALVMRGTLQHRDDVFFLMLEEVVSCVWEAVDQAAVSNRVAVRRRLFEALQGQPYPPFLRGDGPFLTLSHRATRQLQGVGVSPGLARGRARRVPDLNAVSMTFDTMAPGEILVTPSTDPAWTPLFLRAAGLVMERGGQLSHGAVVAREYGLPAVTGVVGALDLIEDGQMIEVDGVNGVVTILEGQHPANGPYTT